MTTIRVARRSRFTQIDRRTVNDDTLSYRARGVLAFLLDKPDDWTTTAERIAGGGTEGRDAIRAALMELEHGRYLERSKWRSTETGRWCSEWLVHERPIDGSPRRVSSTGDALTDNGAPQRVSSAGEPQRVTSDGEPAPENQASITDTETDTEISSDVLRRAFENDDRADPECPSCQGRGRYYQAGAGVDVDCPCTAERKLEVVR